MACGSAAEATMGALPERDDVDGFQFLSFENVAQLDTYLGRLYDARRRDYAKPFPRGYRHNYGKKAGQPGQKSLNLTPSTQTSNIKPKSGKNSGRGRSVKPTAGPRIKRGVKAFTLPMTMDSALVRHHKRLRKGDKSYVEDKLNGFIFVSGFTLRDLDDHDEQLGTTWSAAHKTSTSKRKANHQRVTSTLTKKSRNSMQDVVNGRARLGTSNQDSTCSSKPKLSVPPLKKFGLERLKKLKKKLAPKQSKHTLPCCSRPPTAARGSSKPSAKKGKQFPRMHIDLAGIDGGYISSSSDSENLDVCGIDDESTSEQFIQESINKHGDAADKVNNEDAGKAKKKKCKMCCAHPCKIVEAKRVASLWGSLFPSYNVAFISTCRVHPPGEIMLIPNATKVGSVDACIQTTASDIRMHAHFAERFPHKTIAVTSSNARPDNTPKPLKPGRKSEHHRTNEQKRREQMHDSFIELRKVIYTSQALRDNERASKQWILAEANKVINSLENESVLLTAMKSNLEAKNKKLRKKWQELAGKEFDPNITKSEKPGQKKLIDLYKKYRKDVQSKNCTDVTSKTLSPSEKLAEFCKKRLSQEEIPEKEEGPEPGNEGQEPLFVSDDNEEIPPESPKVSQKSETEKDQEKNKSEKQPCSNDVKDKTSDVTVKEKTPKNDNTVKNCKNVCDKTVDSSSTKKTPTRSSQAATVTTPNEKNILPFNIPNKIILPSLHEDTQDNPPPVTVRKPNQSVPPPVTQQSKITPPPISKLDHGIPPTVSKPVSSCAVSKPVDGTPPPVNKPSGTDHPTTPPLITSPLDTSPPVSKPSASGPPLITPLDTSPPVSKPSASSTPPLITPLDTSPPVSKPSASSTPPLITPLDTSPPVSKPSASSSPPVNKARFVPSILKRPSLPATNVPKNNQSQMSLSKNVVRPSQTVWPPVELPTPRPHLEKTFSCHLPPVLLMSNAHIPVPSDMANLGPNVVQNIVNNPNNIFNNPNQAKLLRIPVTGKMLPTSGSSLAVQISNSIPEKIMNKILASNKPFAVVGTKPTQWTAVGKLIPGREVMVATSMPDVAAFIEVSDEKNNQNENKIILLDVTENQKNSSSPDEKVRALAPMPTSTSINVTLNSFGSITSNKIFNKTPISSGYQKSSANSPSSNKSTEETQPTVPKISEALLSDTGDTNGTGLCVSNVFSLSEAGCGDNENGGLKNAFSVQQNKQTSQDISLHDHNYCKII